jgi:hypothetical protein
MASPLSGRGDHTDKGLGTRYSTSKGVTAAQKLLFAEPSDHKLVTTTQRSRKSIFQEEGKLKTCFAHGQCCWPSTIMAGTQSTAAIKATTGSTRPTCSPPANPPTSSNAQPTKNSRHKQPLALPWAAQGAQQLACAANDNTQTAAIICALRTVIAIGNFCRWLAAGDALMTSIARCFYCLLQ